MDQLGRHGDVSVGCRGDQVVNDPEGFADTDRDVDVVALGGAEVWRCGFNECPGQGSFVVKQHPRSAPH